MKWQKRLFKLLFFCVTKFVALSLVCAAIVIMFSFGFVSQKSLGLKLFKNDYVCAHGKNREFEETIFDSFESLNFNESLINSKHKESSSERKYLIEAKGRKFRYSSADILSHYKLSKSQIELSKNPKQSIEILKNMGLSKQEIVKFLCPESVFVLCKLKENFNKSEKQEKVLVEKNKCKILFKSGEPEVFINEEKFFDDVFECLSKQKPSFKFSLELEEFKTGKSLKECFVEKSSFSTNFSTSSPTRKNNIQVALESFDGLILDDGEVLSFNKTTGERNENSGYQKAKIISGGTFVEGYGGGVCQVSTTLYNACLLSGLEILEVHGHSLPVSYVEPSFDAMVNTGSSDLVIRNNTGGKIIFTTSSENDICKVKIFGLKNKFKITRFSEKTKIIPAEPDTIETDLSKYPNVSIFPGEKYRLSYPKDGYYSNGYLNYYDKFGNLIQTKQIRKNSRYGPVKGILISNGNPSGKN